ncbi:MAG: hypothetical protein DHS20C21_21570 [Gemmatimonadota bacterium]|nr:MAG: hypothetical protein DHS20C21_21570 [Gemmatimonadota bacterium]
MKIVLLVVIPVLIACVGQAMSAGSSGKKVDLGGFSISLAVKDIQASRAFYETLGFEAYDDHADENWLILKNGPATIGLFQGMFENNIITFTPGDVRSIQRRVKAAGITPVTEADETTDGPAHMVLTDPDGNNVLLDQHDPDYKPTSKQ